MGLLNHFIKPAESRLTRLPSGSFTVDSEGRIITYTLPQSFPRACMHDIGRTVLSYFRGANQAEMRVRELVVNYPALKLSARELRGGAIIFLAPQVLTNT
jgi:hypothetical protein